MEFNEIEVRLKDLPGFFKELAIKNQVAQGNKVDVEAHLLKPLDQGGFGWKDSPQGAMFWVNVLGGRFTEAIMVCESDDKLLIVEGHRNPSKVIFYASQEPKKLVYPLTFENMETVVGIITEYRENGFDVYKYEKR